MPAAGEVESTEAAVDVGFASAEGGVDAAGVESVLGAGGVNGDVCCCEPAAGACDVGAATACGNPEDDVPAGAMAGGGGLGAGGGDAGGAGRGGGTVGTALATGFAALEMRVGVAAGMLTVGATRLRAAVAELGVGAAVGLAVGLSPGVGAKPRVEAEVADGRAVVGSIWDVDAEPIVDADPIVDAEAAALAAA